LPQGTACERATSLIRALIQREIPQKAPLKARSDLPANIVIVEDESLVAYYLKKVLEGLNYNVPAIFTSGEEAVANILEAKPDLVLMDIILNGEMDGIDTANGIRAICDVPIVYLTGYDEQMTSDRAQSTEPFGCLLKPFRANELRITVEMALRRHKLEHELRESEERYRLLMETMNDGVIVLDSNQRIQYVNESLCKTMGFSKEEAVGRLLSEFADHYDRAAMTKSFEAGASGERRYYEMEGTSSSGKKVPLIISAKELYDEAGNYTGSIGLLMDVSKLREAEEARRSAEEKYRVLFANISDAILMMEASTLEIIEVNEAAVSLYGWEKEEFRCFTGLDLSADKEASQENYQQVVNGKGLKNVIQYHNKKDGSVFPAEMSLYTFTAGGKEILCAVIRDFRDGRRHGQENECK
jgi:PAS domain S-box-containing protein